MAELMALIIREGGRTIPAALAEVREAVDFLRYYALRGAGRFRRAAERLPGPTGERNEIALHGRGVFACISPWNFPLAIFTGQIAAALAAGNAVIAKPAEQTPLVAAAAVRLLHRAGVPATCCICCRGPARPSARRWSPIRGSPASPSPARPRRRGGSTSMLARRPGPIVPLIAETGGQNAMIVDSSALAEQVVVDVLTSAFESAGQRCSALRLLYLQADIADRLLVMLKGAMAELAIGDPALIATDVGPIIDAAARDALEQHAQRMMREGRLLYQCALPAGTEHGTFFAPRAFEIDSAERLPARGVRPDPARRALACRPARPGARRDRRDRLRPDAQASTAGSTRPCATSSRGCASATPTSTAT